MSGSAPTSPTSAEKPPPRPRTAYPHVAEITTRWMDNDVYGHVNNVLYYSFFDTAVNGFLMAAGVLDPATSGVFGLVVETQCRYLAPVAFPDVVRAGIRVAHLGTASVRYEVGIFRGDETSPAAEGHFVHVYVARDSRRPVPIPAEVRAVLQSIAAPTEG